MAPPSPGIGPISTLEKCGSVPLSTRTPEVAMSLPDSLFRHASSSARFGGSARNHDRSQQVDARSSKCANVLDRSIRSLFANLSILSLACLSLSPRPIEASRAFRRSFRFATDSSARRCKFKSRAGSAAVLSATLPACTSLINRASVSRTAIVLSKAGAGSRPSVTT